MEIIDIIRSFLTPQAIAAQIARRTPRPQRIRKLIYGEEGVQHPFSAITLADLPALLTNIPVVHRGSQAYAMENGSAPLTTIDVQGFDLSYFFTATEINNLKLVSHQTVQARVEGRINAMLDAIQVSTEALCAQGLTGQLIYPMKMDAGFDNYQVDFGETQSFTPDKLWNATDAKIMHVYDTLSAMHSQLQEKGFGAAPVALAGRKAFSQIIGLADESKSNVLQVKVMSENEVSVGGYTVQLESGTYKGPARIMTKTVDDNKLCMVDKDAGHTLFYLSLDDLENGLLPMPFFPSQELKKNPSGLEIVGRSKPLPAPIVGAISWATVLALAPASRSAGKSAPKGE